MSTQWFLYEFFLIKIISCRRNILTKLNKSHLKITNKYLAGVFYHWVVSLAGVLETNHQLCELSWYCSFSNYSLILIFFTIAGNKQVKQNRLYLVRYRVRCILSGRLGPRRKMKQKKKNLDTCLGHGTLVPTVYWDRKKFQNVILFFWLNTVSNVQYNWLYGWSHLD